MTVRIRITLPPFSGARYYLPRPRPDSTFRTGTPSAGYEGIFPPERSTGWVLSSRGFHKSFHTNDLRLPPLGLVA